MKSNRRSSDSLRYLKYSDSFNRENHFRRHKPYNKYLNHKRECFRNKINQNIEKSSNDRREFTRKHYNKKNVSNESQSVAQSEHAQEKINTAESHFKDVKHKNIKPSSFHSPSTSLINQSMEQKGKEIDKDLLNSLSKNHKTNVLDPPMPPILREKHSIPSTSSEKDPKKVKVRKLPNSPEHVQENINTGDSYFKDIKYKNIKPSAFLSPCNKEKPSKIISKRPSVIKSNSPIENPNRNLNEFNKLKKVGEGAYGTVYKAIDLKSNELVAMKKVKMEHENEGWLIVITLYRDDSKICKYFFRFSNNSCS